MKSPKQNFQSIYEQYIKPIQKEFYKKVSIKLTKKKDFFGASPNVFVGHYGYPRVNVGILGTEFYQFNDDPLHWAEHDYTIKDIIDLRAMLVNSQFKSQIKGFNEKFMDISKEISLAIKPVDVEINLEKEPSFKLNFEENITPYGPRVKLKKAKITENPKIPAKVDKVVDDDLKASEALNYLYDTGFDEHYLTKVFSIGNLGTKFQRKLVPTRWSITGVDDIIGRNIISEIKDCQQTNYLAFYGNYFGNHYFVLFFPEPWSYELFETYVGDRKEDKFSTDYESYYGRKEYAFNTVGGYYAARLGVLEKLRDLKRQGSVLVLRFITDAYWEALGVWVVRSAVRKTMRNKPVEFASKELMLDYVKIMTKKRFGYDVDKLLKTSRLLKELGQQKKIKEFA